MLQDPADEIRSHLDIGERLLWSGRPRQGLVFRFEDIFIIPLALFWTVSMSVAVISGKFAEETSVPPLLMVPFLLLGAHFAVGRTVVDILSRRRTSYGVTSNRIIIVHGIMDRHVIALELKTLPGVVLREKRRGEGTIQFTDKPFRFGTNNRISLGPGWGPLEEIPEFDLIPEARGVYDLILTQQKLITTAGNRT